MNDEQRNQNDELMGALFGEKWEKAKAEGMPTLAEIKGRIASLLLAIAMWGDKPTNLKMVGDMAMGGLEGVIGLFDEVEKLSERITFLETLLVNPQNEDD